MSDNGFTKSYRGKWEHPAFRNYAEAALWAWMCDAAAWRRRTFPTKFGRVTLERGQLLFAQNVVAKRFKMGRTVVRRILKTLTDLNMIRTETDHPAANAGTIITIVNYDKYQLSAEQENEEQPTSDQPLTNLQPTSNQQEKEEKESKEKKKEEKAPAGAASKEYRFAGETVKLNEKNYTEWQAMCPNLTRLDLFDGALIGRDIWYRDQPEGVRKNWFMPTSNYLRNEDRKAAKEEQTARGKPPERHWAGDDYIDPSDLPTVDHYL